MKRKTLVFISLFSALVLLTAPALADGVTFSTDQTDYYFDIDEEASIPIGYQNSLGATVTGQMIYKITKTDSSGLFSYSSSNQQSSTMTLPAGSGTFTLSGLTSNTGNDLEVDLSFQYSGSSGTMTVSLGTITVHFTEDSTGKNTPNQQTSQESSSQSSSSAQSLAEQQLQQQQQLINQMLSSGTGSGQSSSSSSQALQNNQQDYNSESLKNQMNEKSEEVAAEKEALSGILEDDDLLEGVEDKLGESGYESDGQSTSVNPDSMDSGTFSKEYKNAAGDTVTLSGTISGGEVESVEETFNPAEQEDLIPESLLNNETYIGYLESLTGEGFSPVSATINYTSTEVVFKQDFAIPGDDQDRERPLITANLSSDLENVTAVDLIRDDDYSWLLPVFLVVLAAVLVAAGYLVYRKYKMNGGDGEPVDVPVERPPFDYRGHALGLLDEAGAAYAEGDYVRAYGRAGQALRVYLSYTISDGAEVTNEELIGRMKDIGGDPAAVRRVLEDCSVVEFAKGDPDPDLFDAIVGYIREEIAAGEDG